MSQQPLQVIQPDNPMSALALIDAKSCEQFARDMAALVHEGHTDPIQVRVFMKVWEKAFEMIKTAIEANVEREAEKHGKSFDFMGAKCEWAVTSTQYDYSRDVEWNRLDKEKKSREAFLKALPAPTDVLDKESAEVVTIYPAIKTQSEGLKISIK